MFYSVFLLIISVWITTRQGHNALTVYFELEGLGLRAPVAYGCFIVIASLVGIVNGSVLVIAQISPQTAEKLHLENARKVYVVHCILSVLNAFLLSVVLVSTIPTLAQIPQSGISTTTWDNLAASSPYAMCRFQLSNRCAGPTDFSCLASDAASSISCPGSFCMHCQAVSTSLSGRSEDCPNCHALRSSSLVRRCELGEQRPVTSRNCLRPLTKQVRAVLTQIVVSTSLGLLLTILIYLIYSAVHRLNSK